MGPEGWWAECCATVGETAVACRQVGFDVQDGGRWLTYGYVISQKRNCRHSLTWFRQFLQEE